jgi:hypothetical protein
MGGDMDTYELPNQEVFKAGTWNGDHYDVDDLDKMVEAYQATAEGYKPKLKLSHYHPKGWPAVGYMDNLRRVGSKLLADFKGIPKKVFDVIKAGGYTNKSAEVIWNCAVEMKDGQKKKFPYLMKAVALLGVDLPAVDNLNGLMEAIYSSDGGEARAYKSQAPEGESKSYDLKTEETHMEKIEQLTADLATANTKLAAAERQNGAAEEQVKKFSKEVEDLKAQVASLTKRAEGAEGKAKEYAAKELKTRITGAVDKLIADKKLAPAMKEKAYALLEGIVNSGTEKKYSVDGKDATLEEIAVDLLGAGSVGLSDKTKSYAGDRPAGGGEEPEGDINTDLAVKAKEYAKQNSVSYADALKAVAREGGVDPSLRK